MKDYRDEKKEDLLPKLNEEEIEWAIAPEKQARIQCVESRSRLCLD